MNAKRIPTPWKVSLFEGGHGEPIICGESGNIAYMQWGAHPDTQAEVKANADFIVRAVNSHDELVGILHTLEKAFVESYGNFHFSEYEGIVLDALRKAKGE